MLKREDFTEAWVERIAAERAARGDHAILSLAVREASRQRALAHHPAGEDLWVFGYGSLIWNPAFHFVERRPARLHGWHRSFCLWLTAGRGSPERPGLMLALDAGGSCRGVAFRIAADAIAEETAILWRREMIAGFYRPRWVTLADGEGPRRALTFVADRAHPNYAGKLDEDAVVRHLAHAEGWLGSGRAYLADLAAHLTDMGIADPRVHRLHDRVRRLQPAAATSPHP